MVTVPLCHIDEIAPGNARGFALSDSGRDSLFVVRQGDDVYSYWNLCPHQGSSLPWQKDKYLNSDGSNIVCYAHGAEFSIETGECTRGAALGMSLIPVTLKVGEDGMIQAEVARLPGDATPTEQ